MPLQKRVARCDICNLVTIEARQGEGWPGWSILNGIGAVAPEPGQPLAPENMETYCCAECTAIVSELLTQLQEQHK